MASSFAILKDRSFLKRIFTIAVPISAQSLISFGVNLMDTVMVGKFGEVALSATSLGGSFFMIFGSICMGLGCGAGVITSQYWGKKEIQPIRDMTSICLKITFTLAMLFTLLGTLFPTQIMRIYTTDPDVIASGAKYLRVLSISFFFNGCYTAITQILRSVNIVRISLFTTIGSFFVNIFFNWVFIFGHFGAPRLGVVGAAIGTVIARVFEFAILGGFLFFRDKTIGFRFRHFRGFSREIFSKYLKSGLPVLISDILMVVGANLSTIIIGHVGAEFTAANSIANVVNNAIFSFFFGISSAATVITGNLIGEGRYRDSYSYGVGFLALSVIVGVGGGLILQLIKWPIIHIYDVSDTTQRYASQMINVMSLILFVQMMEHTLTKGILRGGGDTRFMILADTIFAYIVGAPLGYLAAFVLGAPCWAIYLALRSETFCKVALCLWRFLSKRWIKDVTVKGADVENVVLN